MNLVINGQQKSVSEHIRTIEELMNELKLNPQLVIVEQNGQVIDKQSYSVAPVNEGDQLELVKFVGGG
ncbi:MAG: sulfur carrier protein ThiS [Bacillaceae bacterium]|nr:sulfur carrier protein ThiS [Bacillaceae bacterium]